MFDFKFDFLSQDQNMILSESINYLFGDEMSRLRNENRALADRLRSAEKNSAFLSERNETLSNSGAGCLQGGRQAEWRAVPDSARTYGFSPGKFGAARIS